MNILLLSYIMNACYVKLMYYKMCVYIYIYIYIYKIEWKIVEVPKKYIQNDFQKYIEL